MITYNFTLAVLSCVLPPFFTGSYPHWLAFSSQICLPHFCCISTTYEQRCYPRNPPPMLPVGQKLTLAFWEICGVISVRCIILGNVPQITLFLCLVDRKETGREVIWVLYKTLCGLQTEFLNDILIKSSCCQMLFVFTFKTPVGSYWKFIYFKYCSHITAFSTILGRRESTTCRLILSGTVSWTGKTMGLGEPRRLF